MAGTHIEELANFFLKESDPEKVLDTIELTFRCIDTITRNSAYLHRGDADESASDVIEELNQRFKEHGLGYQ